MGPGADPVNGPGLDYEKLRQFREAYFDGYYVVDPTIDIADYDSVANFYVIVDNLSLEDRGCRKKVAERQGHKCCGNQARR